MAKQADADLAPDKLNPLLMSLAALKGDSLLRNINKKILDPHLFFCFNTVFRTCDYYESCALIDIHIKENIHLQHICIYKQRFEWRHLKCLMFTFVSCCSEANPSPNTVLALLSAHWPNFWDVLVKVMLGVIVLLIITWQIKQPIGIIDLKKHI